VTRVPLADRDRTGLETLVDKGVKRLIDEKRSFEAQEICGSEVCFQYETLLVESEIPDRGKIMLITAQLHDGGSMDNYVNVVAEDFKRYSTAGRIFSA
jgi:hypothetical protein